MADDWIHRAVGIAAQFEAQDQGRTLTIDYTTIVGTLPHEEGEEPVYVVLIEGSETDRGEYWWDVNEYVTVTRTPEGTPIVDDATPEQVKQVTKEKV